MKMKKHAQFKVKSGEEKCLLGIGMCSLYCEIQVKGENKLLERVLKHWLKSGWRRGSDYNFLSLTVLYHDALCLFSKMYLMCFGSTPA
jgi:hypothetical protein